MIRVLHIVIGMNRGGLETLIMNIYRNIDREKVQFDFLVHTNEECAYDQEIIKLGGRIYRISPRNKGIIKNIIALNDFFKIHNYSVVHQHVSSLGYITPIKIAKKNRVPVRIVHSHSSKLSGHKLNLILHYLNKAQIQHYATNYFSCSDVASEWLFPKNIIEKGKVKIVNNGIEINEFQFNKSDRNRIRKMLGISDSIKLIGHIGRFSYPKNHTFLVDIFKQINEKNKDTALVLVGDGSLRDSIEIKVNELGLSDDVFFLGTRSDISSILSAMDLFIFPSLYEGLPVTLIEAQAAGLKCIISSTITKQVQITELIRYQNLKDGAEGWANAILEEIDYVREDQLTSLMNSGYSIDYISNELERTYITLEAGMRECK